MTSTWIIQATVALKNNQVLDGCILKDGTLQTYGDVSYLNQLPKVNELFRQLGLTVRVVTELPSDVLDYTYRFNYIGTNGHIDIVGDSSNLSAPITDCVDSCGLIDDVDLVNTIDELYPLTPIEEVLLLADLLYLVPSCEYMFYPNDLSRDESNRQDLYIPSVGWTDVYSTLTGTMANTGAVTGGIFDFTAPSSVVETYQITWINGGAQVLCFSIGFNRALTDAERAALGQASFWSQLFAGTAIVIGDCTAGEDYYVDATLGLNSNMGLSQESPWKTLSKVNASTFNPGDRIHLKRGEVWREVLTIPSPSITVDAYGTGVKPEVNGALVLKGEWSPSWELLNNGSMEGWQNATTPNAWSKGVSGASTINREPDVVKNGNFAMNMSVDSINSYIDVSQISKNGVASTSYTFSIWHKIPVGKSAIFRIRSQASGNYLHLNGSWGASEDFTLSGTGEWTQYTVTFTSENPTTSFRIYIIRLTATSTNLYFDKVSLRPTTPPAADNIWSYYYNISGGTVPENATGVVVKNCTIDYAQATGAQAGAEGLGSAINWIVRGCNINYNGTAFDAATDHGIYLSHSSGNIIEDNTFIGNSRGWAVQIQDDSNNNIVRRNIMQDNYGGAVVIYNDGGGMPTGIYSNLSIRGGVSAVFNVAGIAATPATNEFYHNTVVDSENLAFNIGLGGTVATILKNNIAWNSVGVDIAVAPVTGVTSDYNIFGPERAGFCTYNTVSYNTLAAYKTASGLDTHSLKDNPLFVGGSDYSLQAGSLAINAGVAIPGITEDILRHPFVGVPDIGAYERV